MPAVWLEWSLAPKIVNDNWRYLCYVLKFFFNLYKEANKTEAYEQLHASYKKKYDYITKTCKSNFRT